MEDEWPDADENDNQGWDEYNNEEEEVSAS